MNVYEELESLSKDKRNAVVVKIYLLECCRKYEKFRSRGTLARALLVAKRFIKGHAKWKEFHELEWLLEGEAFGLEYYRSGETSYWPKLNKHQKKDLINVRLRCRLSHRESVIYLENLAYFIVYVLEYVSNPSSRMVPKEYTQFLCPNLFRKYFKKNA